ncbi:sporulation protein [Variovorax sp. GT1P44]|uniref:sporulation protein n=1 Tax=Variovorax sp. GT1P44 TaxID=3443742 RepID=UPI003F48921F
MIIRLIVVVLLVANLGYYAWTRGGLAVFGMEPARFSEREPQRLTQQVRPQMLQIRKEEPPKP